MDAIQTNNNGGNVQVWDCSGATNQKWEYTPEGFFKSLYNGKCLQVAGVEDIRANVHMWDCDVNDLVMRWEMKGI